MKKGDRVIIYCDPLTRTKIEGEAILVKPIPGFPDSELEYWSVRFPGEGRRTILRWITKEEEKTNHGQAY